MKRFLLLILTGIAISVSAQDSVSIQFQNNATLQQVLDNAAKAKKLVFVEFYTDWCSPCKRLAKEVFTLKSVADTFNSRFINYRINAEKGEGIQLTKKYGVTGFPYMIFTDWNGNLVYSIVGYRSERELLKDADVANSELNDPKPLGIWDNEYNSNKNNTAWLKGYLEKRNKLRMDNNLLFDQYYSLLDTAEYMKPENLLLITKSRGLNLNSKVIRIISKNFNNITPEADSAYHLQDGIVGIFSNAINKPLLQAIKDTNENIILNEVVPANSLFPEKVTSMPWYEKQDGNKWKVIFYSQTKNAKKLIPVATEFFQKYYFTMTKEQIRYSDSVIYAKSKIQFKKEGMDLSSPMIKEYFETFTTNDHLDHLVSGAYTVYKNTKDNADLNAALSWSSRAMEVLENARTAEIHARILYALKRNHEALLTLQKVIDKTEKSEEKERLASLIDTIKQGKAIL